MDRIKIFLTRVLNDVFAPGVTERPEEIPNCSVGAAHIVDPHNLSLADNCANSLTLNNEKGKCYTTDEYLGPCGPFQLFSQKYRRVVETSCSSKHLNTSKW